MPARHRQDVLGRAEALGRAVPGMLQSALQRGFGLCTRVPDVHRDVAPQRGMAAAQPLTATRRDSVGQDVDGSAVWAVSAVQGRGCRAPLEPWHGLGVPHARCGRASALIRACGPTKAEPEQALPEGSCFPQSQPEGHWAAVTPHRHCCPARGAGGSRAGPGPP